MELPVDVGEHFARQPVLLMGNSYGVSLQHAANALRPRRQQHLRLPAITCDKLCCVYNGTTPSYS